jgi:hypothetical protein
MALPHGTHHPKQAYIEGVGDIGGWAIDKRARSIRVASVPHAVDDEAVATQIGVGSTADGAIEGVAQAIRCLGVIDLDVVAERRKEALLNHRNDRSLAITDGLSS